MSFILDALRKSEHERQRQAEPSIADLRAAAPRPAFPVWALALGVLLAINLIVFVVVIIRGESRKAEPPPVSAAPAVTSAAAPPAAVDLSAEPILPRTAASEYRNSYDAGSAGAEPQLQAPATDLTTARTNELGLPTFNELKSRDGTLPEIVLNMHSHAPNAAARFVFINMRQYQERARTAEGLLVERITPDGVVLDYRGQKFFLPRQ